MNVKGKKAQTDAVKQIDVVTAFANGEAQKAATALFGNYENLTQLGQGNFEAVVKANTVLAKGAEEISKELIGIAQNSLENAAVAAKALFGAKTLQDVIALNNEFAKANLDRFLANSAKLSEITVNVANQAIAPLSERVSAAMEKLAKPVAA